MVENYERGDLSALITIDQSAAYDLVDHQILLSKMKIIGANQRTIKWLQSYLSNRTQVVEIDTK